MRLRLEPWGAWAKLESMPALVALDRDGVRALGVDGAPVWDREAPAASAPLEVHLAVTSRCGAGCEGCYLDARPDGHHVPRADLLATLDAMERAGVFTVAFGGGEPILRDDLDELAAEARARGITPVLTTSGLGLTPERAKRLAGFAQINVSYDGDAAAYAAVRGFDGARAAENAVGLLVASGVRTGVNVVLTRQSFPSLEATLERARELGACEAQLLRYKPAGRAARLEYLDRRLSRAQVAALGPTLRAWVRERADGFRVRIDCALVPLLSGDAELYGKADDFTRAGVLGCEAGAALAAVRSDGRVAPCSFLGPGSARGDALDRGVGDDAATREVRDYPLAPAAPCDACELARVCRGGCKVVSSYVDGVVGPDPECPRVVAHRARESRA